MQTTIIRISFQASLCLLAAAWLGGCGNASDPSAEAKNNQDADAGAQTPPDIQATDIPDLDGTQFAKLGDRDFETAKDVDQYGGEFGGGTGTPPVVDSPQFGNTVTGASKAEGTPAAPSVPGVPGDLQSLPSGPQPGADPGLMRDIVEADIVQVAGDTLYVLNRYRGLLLVDMSDPDSPYVIGRVPFQAQPVDMYLRDGRAYIVLSDYFTYWQFDADADPLGFHGSQILVVDVNDPAAPAVLGGFNVDGEVTDTRIVGDVLYAVSHRNPEYWTYDAYEWEDTTWVMSIDIADPTSITEVDRAEFAGSANVIQVYSTALSIAAIDPNYYLVDSANVQQTLITYVDISDPKGEIVVGDGAYVPGSVADKFKMDLQDGQLRVISSNGYWQQQSPNVLTVFDAGNPAKLVQSAQLNLDRASSSDYSQPQATRYAGSDLFVNLCWYNSSSNVQQCRMDLYDLTSPTAPTKVGSLPLDGPVSHFEVRGDRLLALGSRYDAFQSRVQVSLYDISSLAGTRLLSVVALTGGNSSTEAQNDYKAFKVLDELGMILLPLSWYVNNGAGFQSYHNGAQIIDWQADTLTERGRVEQSGSVERAIAFKDRVISISTEQIQVIDARDRAAPVATANLFLVRNVVDVFDIADHQVQLGYDEGDSSFRFFVLPFGADDLADSVAELPVPISASFHMQAGDVIHMVGYEPSTGAQQIRSADFSDPLKPRWRGSYAFGTDIDHFYGGGGYYGYASYYDYYWDPGAGQPLNNELLAITTRDVATDDTERRFYKNYLKIIDLRDPDNLHLAKGSVELPDWGFINRITHGKMLYSSHTEPALDADGKAKKFHERYFVDRVDASDPDSIALLPKVSVPGVLVDVDDSGTILYTVDYQWDEHGRRRNSLNVLKLEGNEAVLTAVLPVGDDIDRARYRDREIWLATQGYPWWGRMDDSPDSRQPYTRLTRLRIDKSGKIAGNDAHAVAGYHFDLLDVDGPSVYLASSYPTGLLVLDTTDFAEPKVVSSARTIGYVSKIVRKDDYLYMPMGSYGVRRTAAN